MSATGPVICHACWAKKDNHYDACECVKGVIEYAKSHLAQQLTAKDATIADLQREIEGLRAELAAANDYLHIHREDESEMCGAINAALDKYGVVFGPDDTYGACVDRLGNRATTAERQLEAWRGRSVELRDFFTRYVQGEQDAPWAAMRAEIADFCEFVDANPLASSAVRGERQQAGTEGTS